MELESGKKLRFYPRFNNSKKINLGEEGWMNEYCSYYFNIDNVVIRNDDINDICNNYIEGLQGILNIILKNALVIHGIINIELPLVCESYRYS